MSLPWQVRDMQEAFNRMLQEKYSGKHLSI
jgi:hypothetical protein